MILCSGAGWTQGTDKYKDLLKLSENLSDDCAIVLVGNYDKQLTDRKNIYPVGYVNSIDELAKINSIADVYVHLSYEDTFGKVIAEALACGTPAIVYNSTACPELIKDGCGYVVDGGDIKGILNAIEKIKEDGKEKYSDSCVNYVRGNFEKNNLIEQTLNIYKEISERGN